LNFGFSHDGGRTCPALAACRCNIVLQLNIQHMLIEENQRIESLSLRGGGHFDLCRQVREKRFYIFCTEKFGVSFAAEVMNITKYPLTIGLLRAI